MSTDAAKTAVDKLTIIKEIANSTEVQQVAKVVIEYIESTDKPKELGFSADKDKK